MITLKLLPIIFIFCLNIKLSSQSVYTYDGTDVSKKCPGKYCGRSLLADGNWSTCGACPRGTRANSSTICTDCSSNPVFYDWLYLGFMFIIVLVLHWFCIDSAMTSRKKFPSDDSFLSLLGQQPHTNFTPQVLAIHSSALIEVCLSALLTILLLEPKWSFKLNSCNTKELSDWYTLLHNPTPEYKTTLHCTQEAVFPLYSMIFIFYASCVLFLLLIRPWMVKLVTKPLTKQQINIWENLRYPLPVHGKKTIYAALYFLPLLALVHALFAGLIYYSFPYIMMVLSIISNATHFAYREDQSVRGLFTSIFTNIRNSVILFGHWLLHAYAIIAITHDLLNYLSYLSFIALVPIPAILYIITANFTDPNKIHSD